MTERKAVQTDVAPKAIGPYSQALLVGNTLYISGQLGFDPATGKLVDGDTAAQAEQALKNIMAILMEENMSMHNVAQVQVFLADIADFAAVNEVYKSNGTVMFFFQFVDTLTTCTTDFCFFIEH